MEFERKNITVAGKLVASNSLEKRKTIRASELEDKKEAGYQLKSKDTGRMGFIEKMRKPKLSGKTQLEIFPASKRWGEKRKKIKVRL